jgi:hypothetical protein
LVSVHYEKIVAKSNRLKTLLARGSKNPSAAIRGVKFKEEGVRANGLPAKKHVFTYFIDPIAITETISRMKLTADYIRDRYGESISHDDIDVINKKGFPSMVLSKSIFINTVIDIFFVERFNVDSPIRPIEQESIITIYKTAYDTPAIFSKLGIPMIAARMIDDTTLRLTPDEIRILQEKAPYLISMEVRDLSEISIEDIQQETQPYTGMEIPSPSNEPTIGVIDTHFDESVYFHKWVKYHNMLEDIYDVLPEDRVHGTAVSSLIVDGPALNPHLEDGCGRFKVRLFGVASARKFSSFTVLKSIKRIVAENRDIKVWNLSLGSYLATDENFISPEGAELDKMQSEYDVIFILAGTNRLSYIDQPYRIGAPADSLNSLVVNSVDLSGNKASYHRVGPVLSFFHKPDLSSFGGDGDEKVTVCKPFGLDGVTGTSYAAPWIARKMAYLMHIQGLSREVSKAILIHSAADWSSRRDTFYSIGYGIVPRHMDDILYTRDDEIRFVMSGVTEEYETYTYNIPVPMDGNSHPFFARATLAYFPQSDRNQGVDYTSTEMDIHFGRVMENKDGKHKLNDIKNNIQDSDELISLFEEDARRLFRKWDNVKHVSEEIKRRAIPRKAYTAGGSWGIRVYVKDRIKPKTGRGLNFGLVITLREMNGKNRIHDFIKMCQIRGWLVNRIDVHQNLDVYALAEEELEFDQGDTKM